MHFISFHFVQCVVPPFWQNILESSLQSGSQVAVSWVGNLLRWLDQNQGCRTERACCKGGKHFQHRNDGRVWSSLKHRDCILKPVMLGSLCRDLNDKMAHAIQEPSYFGWMPGCDHGIHVSHWGDAWKCKLYGEFKLILKKKFSCCHCCWTKAEEFDEDWSSNIG